MVKKLRSASSSQRLAMAFSRSTNSMCSGSTARIAAAMRAASWCHCSGARVTTGSFSRSKPATVGSPRVWRAIFGPERNQPLLALGAVPQRLAVAERLKAPGRTCMFNTR